MKKVKIIIYKIKWRFKEFGEFGEDIYKTKYFSSEIVAESEYLQIKKALPKGSSMVMYKQIIEEDINFELTKKEEVIHYNDI